ncbi:MAG TPA: TonB-dependent receptor [Gemmatimonadaceae bacterium]|nr:TonB-dependent receptor [Gemmatimonadaceae bacterium]
MKPCPVTFVLKAVLLLAASAVDAQEPAPDSTGDSTVATPPTAADSARTRLPTVTVKAARAAQSTFAIPLAITVVGRERLENRRGYSLDEALQDVPGVVAQSRAGGSDIRLSIRGFGARGAGDRSNAGTSRGVRVLLDGIPETEPDGRTSFDLIDLAAAERLEVVRSNASALWGNAGGGVVSISTVPSFEKFFADLQQIGGSFGLRRSVVRAGTRLGTGSLVATFTNTSQHGWRDRSDSRRFLLNTALTSQLGGSTDFGLFVSAANDLFHIPGPLTMAEALATPRIANATYASRDERRFNRLGRIGMTLEHSFGESSSLSGMLFVNPKVLQRSERNTFRDFNRYHLGGNVVYRGSAAVSPRLRATTLLGVDEAYQNGTILFYSLTPEGTRGTELRDNKGEGALNSGIFAQEELLFNERLGLDLGARYDVIRYDYRSFIDPSLDAVKSFSRLTPKIGVNYRPSSVHSFYASVGGGIEAPAGNETDPASTFGQDTVTAINPLLDAIRSTTFELGTKHALVLAALADATLAYDVAGYWTEVTNDIVPYRGGRFFFTAGKVRRRGVEAGASLVLPAGLELRGNASYSRNRYIEYTVDSVHYGKPGAIADYAGNAVAGVPGTSYFASVAHPLGPVIPLRLELSLRGVGDYFADDANVVRVPDYHTVALTMSTSRLIHLSSQIGLRAFVAVENLTDRRYIGSAFVNPDVVNGVPVAFEPGSPRAFVVSVSLGWR